MLFWRIASFVADKGIGGVSLEGTSKLLSFRVRFSASRVGFMLMRPSSMSGEELIRACAERNDGGAWEEFVVRFRRPISLSILRVAYQSGGIPQQVVDDLVQETYLKLCADKCRLLCGFASQHPEAVTGYIKTIAVNVAHDYFKALRSQKRGEGEIDQFPEDIEAQAASGSFGGPDAMQRGVLLNEIHRCLETSSAGPDQERDCLIFRLYYQQGMTAKAISALPTVGLTAKGVEAAIFRLTRQVRELVVGVGAQNSAAP
jgi:RNA polymerase sigma-70 factor, ECF subfamily